MQDVTFLDFDFNYLRGYDKYINSEIFAFQYPKDKIEVATWKIKEIMKINDNDYEFKHDESYLWAYQQSMIIF